ncbi:hypothetical protein Acr_00g0002630 [Actinidia rufa]|uniref:Uncharacterized protein n=1 Tax=Actinidia rufa TaxID=165716 RepID=A0A7J0D8Q6_9ERIC|nr:hypothetical protein Acr_00g0002630 [Actinidia rufa]
MPQLPLSVFLVSVGTALATRLTKWSNRRSTCPLPCPFRRRDSIKTQRVVGRTKWVFSPGWNIRFRLGNSFLSDLPHCRRKEPEQPLEKREYGRERSGIDSPITRLASATGKGTVAIASSPGQSSLPQRGVGSAKIDGKLPGLGFAISSVLSSVPCLDLFGFKVGVLFFHFQLS